MKTFDIIRAWRKILRGERPSLSIEITRECPLRCPGCYAFDDAHLGGELTLRDLHDLRGQELIDGVLEVVDRLKPLHLSLVGGDPLVRYRELESLIPPLLDRGIHVQVVTSAFRRLPPGWAVLPHMNVVVSIDGLQPEHDLRRAPATYDRILKNIAGQKITIHCTVTGQIMKRPGYLKEFLEFWTPRAEIYKVWFSLFTPQLGDRLPEILQAHERLQAIADMMALRREFPKLDMPEGMIRQFATPPQSPSECAFALTTHTLSADLKTRILPCQFGGKPDCSSCGCVASMGLAAVAAHKLCGVIPVGAIFKTSVKFGQARAERNAQRPQVQPGLPVLPTGGRLEAHMSKHVLMTHKAQITSLRELSARIGSDPLLTQASTGNSSMKLDGVLWIKASGKWMADATRKDILIPLDLREVRECVKQQVDPAGRYASASIETAMHAVLPHRVVLHVHSVNTIAWAVRRDARVQLEHQLDGLRWRWIPYIRSGLPLAREIEKALAASANTEVLVLGNHGLVVGGDDCGAVENLLSEVERRLSIRPRQAPPADYAALVEIANGSAWEVPEDNAVHALGTDAISQAILSGGLLYPCQAVLSNSNAPTLFRSIAGFDPTDQWESRFSTRQFLILEGCGLVVRRTMTLTERKMISGLAQVVQRIGSSAALRYLTEDEVANSSGIISSRYRELTNASDCNNAR